MVCWSGSSRSTKLQAPQATVASNSNAVRWITSVATRTMRQVPKWEPQMQRDGSMTPERTQPFQASQVLRQLIKRREALHSTPRLSRVRRSVKVTGQDAERFLKPCFLPGISLRHELNR